MGYPLSRFQHLASLCSDGSRVNNIFSKYKVVSLVVHSTDDDAFINLMKRKFEALHKKTGENFAFITFLNPTENWARNNYDWMELRKSFICGENCEDEDFVRLLRKRLNLPDCPALVLTTDLLSNKYIVLPTDHDLIVNQMEEISSALSGSQYENMDSGFNNDFITFLKKIGQPYDMATEDGKSLARNITDLLAIRSINGRGIDCSLLRPDARFRNIALESQKNEARQWVMRTLSELKSDLDLARNQGSEDNTLRALTRYSDYLSEYVVCKKVSSLSRESISSVDNLFRRHTQFNGWSTGSNTMSFQMGEDASNQFQDRRSWPKAIQQYQLEGSVYSLRTKYEKNSVEAIRQYNHLVPFLLPAENIYRNYPPERADDIENGFTTDLSPLGLYLGQIIEDEMNASIIQFLRQKNGIPMPEYFRIYDPTKGPVPFETRNKRILLNKKFKLIYGDTYSVRLLQIGETNCILRNLLKRDALDNEIKCFGNKEYLTLMTPFCNLRNDSSHPGIITRDKFDNMYQMFMKIVEKYFPEMLKLKEQMKLAHPLRD